MEIDPNMIIHPRTNPYIRTDDWDAEAEKWFARKAAEKDAARSDMQKAA